MNADLPRSRIYAASLPFSLPPSSNFPRDSPVNIVFVRRFIVNQCIREGVFVFVFLNLLHLFLAIDYLNAH